MPNVIAARSIANDPSSAGLRRTNARPSAIERPIAGRSLIPSGSCGESWPSATTIARQLAASTAYAPCTPAAAMSRPPSPGPTTIVSW